MARPLPTTPPRHTVFDTPVLGQVLRWIGMGILRAKRWRTEVRLPPEGRFVAVIAPHTSFWDFPILVSMALEHRVKCYWMGKHTLFRGPFRYFFRWLGGIPVNPADNGDGRVAGAVRLFAEHPGMRLAIAPEAGLGAVTRWRSGFYHIAVGAGVPLLLVYADYRERMAGASAWFTPTGDMAADYERLRAFYRDIVPRHPAGFALPEVGE